MLPDSLLGCLDAADDFADGLSDESWFAHMESAVRTYNKKNRTRFDPNSTVLAWMQSKQT